MAQKILITGGAGFIGSNYARRCILRGDKVTILDNLSRNGAKENLDWIATETVGKPFEFIKGDIRDPGILTDVVKDKEVILHLAAQVAVTSSVVAPKHDFEVNALGTFNVLEAVRLAGNKPLVLYASTNKVYGGIEDVPLIEKENTYAYASQPDGISESQRLDFHSPYGCSKGCGDQYVRDFSRIYGFPTVVFRQSCIYGTRQFGIEDQGWVAWFVIAAILGKHISIYGDGKQVRDLLFIDDLMKAYDLAIEKIHEPGGDIFNIGGGKENAISVWLEFAPILEEIHGKAIPVDFNKWRPGDQKIYISDISKARDQLDWSPEVTVKEGVSRLYEWVAENKTLFA